MIAHKRQRGGTATNNNTNNTTTTTTTTTGAHAANTKSVGGHAANTKSDAAGPAANDDETAAPLARSGTTPEPFDVVKCIEMLRSVDGFRFAVGAPLHALQSMFAAIEKNFTHTTICLGRNAETKRGLYLQTFARSTNCTLTTLCNPEVAAVASSGSLQPATDVVQPIHIDARQLANALACGKDPNDVFALMHDSGEDMLQFMLVSDSVVRHRVIGMMYAEDDIDMDTRLEYDLSMELPTREICTELGMAGVGKTGGTFALRFRKNDETKEEKEEKVAEAEDAEVFFILTRPGTTYIKRMGAVRQADDTCNSTTARNTCEKGQWPHGPFFPRSDTGAVELRCVTHSPAYMTTNAVDALGADGPWAMFDCATTLNFLKTIPSATFHMFLNRTGSDRRIGIFARVGGRTRHYFVQENVCMHDGDTFE